MNIYQDRPASSGQWLRRHDLLNFITTLYEGDLHAKRVLSLANATVGVLTSASLAIHAVGRGLAQAMGTLTKRNWLPGRGDGSSFLDCTFSEDMA